ncbi:MAG: sodium-dependent transporter [Verrucomicrobiota bacterium JB022]|nr:sodium-dependent transporter [Verrucomicrobiota bacterium JB022]
MAVKESWNSRLGVILAVAGSAVGIGNFLRFPGNVAQYGGGAFMLAYVISFLIIGLPLSWAEWTMARYGGQRGFHSPVGVFHAVTRRPWGKFVGVIGIVIPVCIYMYYVVVESWCLGYACNFLFNPEVFSTSEGVGNFFGAFTGIGADGSAWGMGMDHLGTFLIVCFALNFFLIYRGISKGIEMFCNYAMPALLILALIVLVRVLTLGTPNPEIPSQNITNGLGFMWNPNKVELVETTQNEAGDSVEKRTQLFGRQVEVVKQQLGLEGGEGEPLPVSAAWLEQVGIATPNPEASFRVDEISAVSQLAKPDVWLAAAGQIFFSLSVGFGVILTYASYLKKDDDVILSGLTAVSANEFSEVGLGGLITVPAAFAFFGVTASVGSTFGLGFVTLPNVFGLMPAGNIFGFLFFFLLFLAAVTSSLSMLQPGIAFLEGALGIGRKLSVAILGLITAVGAIAVVSFSKDVKMLDHLDFWGGTFLIFVFATIQISAFAWLFGIKNGMKEAHTGSAIRIPKIFQWTMATVTPLFLITIFVFWMKDNVFGQGSSYVTDLIREPKMGAWAAVVALGLFGLFSLIVTLNSPRYKSYDHGPDQE